MKQLLIFLFFIPISLFSQHLEVGLLVGGANYMGELSNNSSKIYLKETNLTVGAFVKYNLNHLAAVRLHFNYATVSGADKNSGNSDIINRNLDFQSDIYEFGLIGEFNILGYEPYNYVSVFSPYVFGGIALFQFNPQGDLNGQLFDLQPLGTEGQGLQAFSERSSYKLSQFAIPFGIGVKYALTESLNIGFEIGGRKLFTDYLDDVSLTYPGSSAFILQEGKELSAQLSDKSLNTVGDIAGQARGDTKANDWYFITGITISYNFMDNGLIGGRGKAKKSKTGCPTF